MGLVSFWTPVPHGFLFADRPGPALDVSEPDQRNGGTVQPMTRRNDDLEVIPVTAFENIVSDCELVEQVMTRGKSEFARSCAQCHGADGTGGKGYPNLTDSDWLWGGSLDAIETTIRYGIRAEHEETRYTEMPAFLREGILTLSEIDSIATHVLSLSGGGTDRAANLYLSDGGTDRAANGIGAELFVQNCAICHRPQGQGDPDIGGGGSLDAIETTIRYGIRAEHEETRYTEMPAFLREGILTLSEIDSIATHVLSLSGGGTDRAANLYLSDGGTDRAANGIGAELFVQNCAICHRPQGQGDPDIGVPRLNDEIWLYGADMGTVVETIAYARNATMPYWVDKLDDATIKLLAIYVRLLGGRDSRGASHSCERTG